MEIKKFKIMMFYTFVTTITIVLLLLIHDIRALRFISNNHKISNISEFVGKIEPIGNHICEGKDNVVAWFYTLSDADTWANEQMLKTDDYFGYRIMKCEEHSVYGVVFDSIYVY